MSKCSEAESALERAMEMRQEILHEIRHGKISRRAMLKRLVAAGGAFSSLALVRGAAHAQEGDVDPALAGTGPATRPFLELLPHINRGTWVKQPETLTPEPTAWAQTTAGGVAECRRDDHQGWDTCWGAYPSYGRKTYLFRQKAVRLSFHRDLPLQQCWAFDGRIPGPTIRARYGEPCIVRIINELPSLSQHRGFGLPETTTHLHNGHTASESDGNPSFYFPRQAELNPNDNDTGRFRDHLYPNIYPDGDPREALGTLWYHDHRHNFTAPNVLRGLQGFYLLYDEVDSGNENDANPRALRLPSGDYDVPMLLCDVLINRAGYAMFDQLDFDGYIGNKFMVNGKIQPRFPVEPRKYRIRLLNGGVSRSYGLSLMMSSSPNGPVDIRPIPGALIVATDGNLLPAPIPLREVNPLGNAQRLDVVVDFSKVPKGSYVFLTNRWAQADGRKPIGAELPSTPDGVSFDLVPGPGFPIMRFDVSLPYRGDPSRVPASLRELPWQPDDALSRLGESEIRNAVGQSKPFPGVERVREWKFERSNNGLWQVNNALFDPDTPVAQVGQGTGEIWVLEGGGGWTHPIHIHQEEHRTLFRGGQRPGPQHREFGRSDVLQLAGGERAVLYRKFRTWKGQYVMHCHNLVHEDHAMMVRWDIE